MRLYTAVIVCRVDDEDADAPPQLTFDIEVEDDVPIGLIEDALPLHLRTLAEDFEKIIEDDSLPSITTDT